MNIETIKTELSKNKEMLYQKYDLAYLGIFGSYVRGDNTLESDVDILVDFNKPIGIRFIDLADELENILKAKVDLVSRNGIKDRYLKYIEQDLTYVS